VNDARAMELALEEGRRALGATAPNPPVGAVIVRGGEVIGRGFTRPPGGDHAEVVALRDAREHGHDVRGATMVVTLEPCCHWGRTPPCTDAIVAAGLARVVVGVVDPYPPMQGNALEQLRSSGIEVSLGVCRDACRELMRGFLRVHEGGLPEVTLKAAISLDGRIATSAGESRWVTGEAARRHGHVLRSQHDAILVGAGTVVADDPRLTCRVEGGNHPVPVVLDTGLRIAADAKVLHGERRAVVVCGDDAPDRELPADVVRVPRGPGGVDVVAALDALGRRGLHRVLVEGGGRVHRSLLDAGVVDALHVYVAGTVIPGGIPWVGGEPLAALGDAPRFGAPDVERLGSDVLLRYRSVRGEG
jgi:diaminohydroxyphosphoribosylaminopyrimidine deaminase/5-amino-6-(5-phosphoribosylamino)uracil reductase